MRFRAFVVGVVATWVGGLGACGGTALDVTDGGEGNATSDAGTPVTESGASSEAGAEGTTDCPASYPICRAFRNDGAQGGAVSVRVDPSAGLAYVTTRGLAAHAMGPYGTNPNTATARALTLSIPLVPKEGDSPAGNGHVAVAWNGVALFNPSDARNIGGCTGNAAYLEADGVDAYGGHPAPGGEYHYHTGFFLTRAAELGLVQEPGKHSSLVGYAFDGVPIYGTYGYSDPQDPASAVRPLRSCYRLKPERTCCQDISKCSLVAQFERKTLVLGAFVEDYAFDDAAYRAGECDLDAYNSRVAKTPEYPEGARVYVMTIDDGGTVTYPFVFGTRYWGVPAQNPR
ncbi:MAG: YHYH protein [Myxococcales bacterium]|nr:YHYH protein [Myxococcales bacterium]